MKWLMVCGMVISGAIVAGCRGVVPAEPVPEIPVEGVEAEPVIEPTADTSGVVIATDKTEYYIGESLIVTVTNNSDKPIQYIAGCATTVCRDEGELICAELECDGSAAELAAGEQVVANFIQSVTGDITQPTMLQRFGYMVEGDPNYMQVFSEPYVVLFESPNCEGALQAGRDYAQASEYASSIDIGRVVVRWQDADATCEVDFAWSGAGEIQPGLWSEGYSVIVKASTHRVESGAVYER